MSMIVKFSCSTFADSENQRSAAAGVLRDIARRIESTYAGTQSGCAYDINGQQIGVFELTLAKDEPANEQRDPVEIRYGWWRDHADASPHKGE